jgi:hypothetical protein
VDVCQRKMPEASFPRIRTLGYSAKRSIGTFANR